MVEASVTRRVRGAARAVAPAAPADLVAVCAAVLLFAGCLVWGRVLTARGARLHLAGAAPLSGPWQVRVDAATALAVVTAVLLVTVLPRAADRLAWRPLLVLTGVAAGAWACALALVDGTGGITRPLTTRYEYLHDVGRVGDIPAFLAGFVDRVPDPGDGSAWVTHVAGHPPGALLSFVVLDRLGLGGPGWASALCVVAGAAGLACAVVALRAVAGEPAARTAMPYLATAPLAVWLATSADALFLGVSAAGVALLAVATVHTGRRADTEALAGGALLGWSLFLSYGLVLLAPVVLATVLVRRRTRPLLVAAAGVLAVAATFAVAGFSWLAGLAATRDRVAAGAAAERPSTYFVVANLAALAVALGPAGVAALARLRGGRSAWLPGGALLAVAVADLSGLSRGEVERVWLPFLPWLLTATARLPAPARRAWLAAQLGTGLLVQTMLLSRW